MRSVTRRLVRDSAGLNTACWPLTVEHLVTPIEHFFVRSHAPLPRVDPAEWRLEIGGLVARPRQLSLEELTRAFPRRDVVATLVCAGLRRDEYLSLGELPGELPWGPEPAGTGHWSGIALGDLLRSVEVLPQARHVEVVGLDQVERDGLRFGFGGSIDLAKALSDEVLLATHLNGSPLPVEHGFPLRALVPGWIGARSVKWLGRITLAAEPSTNYFQARAYRFQPTRNPDDPRDVSGGTALTGVPLNAVILDPLPGQTVEAGPVPVRGWAMGAEGRPLAAIEVSPDGGRSWLTARIAARGGRWSWSFWEMELELAPGAHTLAVRARDSDGTTQPAEARDTWNVKGYCNNAWHRVAVRAE